MKHVAMNCTPVTKLKLSKLMKKPHTFTKKFEVEMDVEDLTEAMFDELCAYAYQGLNLGSVSPCDFYISPASDTSASLEFDMEEIFKEIKNQLHDSDDCEGDREKWIESLKSIIERLNTP